MNDFKKYHKKIPNRSSDLICILLFLNNQVLQAFAFCVVKVNDENTKPSFKRKLKD